MMESVLKEGKEKERKKDIERHDFVSFLFFIIHSVMIALYNNISIMCYQPTGQPINQPTKNFHRHKHKHTP
jgi:hypothetical protein